MIDIRDKKQVLAALRQAKRRFEKGAPVPYEVRALLNELAEGLADSGPFELGVLSSTWLDSTDSANRGVAEESVRAARRAIRELTHSFGGRDWSRLDCVVMPFAFVLVLPTLMFAIPLVLVGLLINHFITRRYLPDVRKVVTTLELPDRVLFAYPVRTTGSLACSPLRARFGSYVHPVLVATDRRVLLAEPPSDLPVQPDRQRFSITREVSYSRIRSAAIRVSCVTQVLAIDTDEYKISGDEAKALVAIITRHAPECQLSSPEIVPEYTTGAVTSSATDTLGLRAASSAATGEKL
jgi:hypothetical protein